MQEMVFKAFSNHQNGEIESYENHIEKMKLKNQQKMDLFHDFSPKILALYQGNHIVHENSPAVPDYLHEEGKPIDFKSLSATISKVSKPTQETESTKEMQEGAKGSYAINGPIVVKTRRTTLVLTKNTEIKIPVGNLKNNTLPPGKTKTPQESMSVSDDCLESNSLYGIISSSDKGDNIYMDMDGEVLKEINMCTKTSADSPRDPPDHSMRSASESEDSGDSYNEEENESNEDSGSDNGMSQDDNDDSDEGDGDDGDNQGIQDTRFFQLLKKVLQDIGGNVLNQKERNLLEHFVHAHRCPKINSNQNIANFNNVCKLPACKEPLAIVKFCQEVLIRRPFASDDTLETACKILMHHFLSCGIPSYCNMALCKHYRKIMTLHSTGSFNINDAMKYKVVFSKLKNAPPPQLTHSFDFTLVLSNEIGKGGFGQVSNGCFRTPFGDQTYVAVKKIKIVEESRRTFETSLSCMQRFGSHPNILLPKLVLEGADHYLQIMPCADICLFKYTERFLDVVDEQIEENSVLILRFCCFYLYQMAKAIKYVHQFNLVHGDIKPANFVLADNLRTAKLIDWDFLKEEQHIQKSGTKGFAAPEVIGDSRNVRCESDVYSLCRSIYPLVTANQKNLNMERCTPVILAEEISKTVQNEAMGIIFLDGTKDQWADRLSIDAVINRLDNMQELKQARVKYRPPPKIKPIPESNEEKMCLEFVRNWTLRKLRQNETKLDDVKFEFAP